MRCFLAVDINDETKNNIVKVQNELKEMQLNAKFVEKQNLHFTLSFLGEVDKNEIDKIKNDLNHELKTFKIFTVNLKGIGYFGSSHNIRNMWIGLDEGKESFHDLFMSIRKHIRNNDSHFSPHVTLCRIKKPVNTIQLIEYVNDMKDREIGHMNVNQVKLKESILSQKGPEYRDIQKFILGDIQ